MEDAHVADLELDVKKKISLFGVFDGHGGAEVATYSRRHLANILKGNANFVKGAFEESFKESFL